MGLGPVWTIHLQVGLDDPCGSLPTQNILYLLTCQSRPSNPKAYSFTTNPPQVHRKKSVSLHKDHMRNTPEPSAGTGAAPTPALALHTAENITWREHHHCQITARGTADRVAECHGYQSSGCGALWQERSRINATLPGLGRKHLSLSY